MLLFGKEVHQENQQLYFVEFLQGEEETESRANNLELPNAINVELSFSK